MEDAWMIVLELDTALWWGFGFLVFMGALMIHDLIVEASRRSGIRKWCAGKDFELVKFTTGRAPNRKLTLRIRRKGSEEIELWEGSWVPRFGRAEVSDFYPVSEKKEPVSRQLSAPDPEFVRDPDEAIMAEVSRRLDQITSQSGWADAHDLDGSGHIDKEEFEALRAQVIAEVRAEFASSEKDSNGVW